MDEDEAASTRAIAIPPFTTGTGCRLPGARPMAIGTALMSPTGRVGCRMQPIAAIAAEGRRGWIDDKLSSTVAQKIAEASSAVAAHRDSHRIGVGARRPAP